MKKWLVKHFTGLWGLHYQLMDKTGKFKEIRTISWWRGAPKLFLFLVIFGFTYGLVQSLDWLFIIIGSLFVVFVVYINYLAKYSKKTKDTANDIEKENY